MSRLFCCITPVLCALMFSGCTLNEPAAAHESHTFHVSPKGNDAWSGCKARPALTKKDGPFRTIARARDAVRALKTADGALKRPVTVILDDGVYYQSEELVFTPEDSGTAESPVTYTARNRGGAVISGGFALQGWQPDHGERSRAQCDGKLWNLTLPAHPTGAAWNFNQLYINGERRTRARTPNRGTFFRSDGPTGTNENREFFFKEGDVTAWHNLRQALFVVYHSWETSLHHVHAIDADAGIVTFRETAPWPMGRWEKQQRYYVEGIWEGLDHPGEWYLDAPANTLYYYPLPGETPRSVSAVAPILRSTLISFKGEPAAGTSVEHIRFKGIAFRHTDANLARLRNPGQGEIYQPALIMATGLRHGSFEECEISCAGAHALWLASGCSENTVRQCHLHALGGGGVYIGGGWGVGEAAPAASNTVDNCFIHDAGNLFHGAHGVWIGKSSYNRITHNEIKNLDYSGISCGWSWGFQPSSAHHNTIDFNHIHHLSNGEGLSDMGGIYTLGVSPGTTLRGNHIHDIYSYAHVSHGSGLYPDEGSSHILMEDNVVYRVRNSPLFMHFGADCTVRNNILALGDKGQLRRSREDKRCHYSAVGNIVYSEHPQMLDGPWKNKDWLIASNLYWCTAGEPQFAGRDFAQWQAEGNDTGSLVADPLFIDPAAGDFRFRPGSPAAKIGFRPVDAARAGLYGDPQWRSLPEKFPNRARIEIAPPITLPIVINYTFEESMPGAAPFDAQIIAEGASKISITDEVAAGGSQSLKFTDAPGLRHRWMPHAIYNRSYTNGVIHLSWDMLNSRELPADFSIELRDYTGAQYAVGPSVSVNAAGTVKANGIAAGTLPPASWASVSIEINLDGTPPTGYKLRIACAGAPAIEKVIPLPDKRFSSITWLGVTGNSDGEALFYLDNLRMGTAEELANPPRRPARRKPDVRTAGKPYGADRISGYWKFDENAGYTAIDSSGCDNHGEMWARLAAGAFGTAAAFDLGNSHIRIPDAPGVRFGTESFAVTLWLCPESLEINTTDPRSRFMGKNKFPATWWNFNLTPNGRITVELADDQKNRYGFTSNGGIPARQWTHLAVSVDRSAKEAKIFINGKVDAGHTIPASFSGSLDVVGGELQIGSSWQPFTGLIDAVKLYKRVLSAQEIEREFSTLKTQYGESDFKIIE